MAAWDSPQLQTGRRHSNGYYTTLLCCTMQYCAVLCCAVLCCSLLCLALLCCSVRKGKPAVLLFFHTSKLWHIVILQAQALLWSCMYRRVLTKEEKGQAVQCVNALYSCVSVICLHPVAEKYLEYLSRGSSLSESTAEQIRKDLYRTIPGHARQDEIIRGLSNVLTAYAARNPAVGCASCGSGDSGMCLCACSQRWRRGGWGP